MSVKYEKIAFLASRHKEARKALAYMQKHYQNVPLEEADVIVALGGDGFMLHALHQGMAYGLPVYGMNQGSVGFLMNQYRKEDLKERLGVSQMNILHPLRMNALSVSGESVDALAFNEVSLFRETRLAAKICIQVDGVVRLEEMICDGVLLSTPAGSSAYNFSAYGPILPLNSNVLALTPISVYRPRRWRGALVPGNAAVTFKVLTPGERHVGAVADFTETHRVSQVTIHKDHSRSAVLLFDQDHDLEERIIKEQFIT